MLNVSRDQFNRPGLTIEDQKICSELAIYSSEGFPKPFSENCLFNRNGYLQIKKACDPNELQLLSSEVEHLVKQGLPPVFVFVYDQAWLLPMRLHNFVQAYLTEEYIRLPDFWCWYVNPDQEASGWKPHRDKGYRTLDQDGLPEAITMWIPLTNATPLNGCMYVIPKDRDPTYGKPNDKSWEFNLQDIRALPAPAGDVLIWDQAVLHWGARASEMAATPRISVAFEFQRSSSEPYNKPISPPLSVPDFQSRLRLIAKQILQYQHMYTLSGDLKDWAEGIT